MTSVHTYDEYGRRIKDELDFGANGTVDLVYITTYDCWE
jgi:hypothetical protein